MGICSSKKSDKEAGIRQQIEQTIVEQEKIKAQEEMENYQDDRSSRKSIGQQFTNLTTNANPAKTEVDKEQGDEEPPQQKTSKKKSRSTKDDVSYFRKSEHVLKVTQLIVELIKEEIQQYYNITIGINMKENNYLTTVNGILITQFDHQLFTLKPATFKEANKYSRFPTFFTNDTYFNIDKECQNNFNAFDKLLYVERSFIQKTLQKQTLKKKFSTISEPQDKEIINTVNQEMFEIISVVDVEQQSRFLSVLFHLLMQQHHPSLEENLIFIKNATLLFERPPQFDQPNVYRLGLFYDRMEYSLKDLQQILQTDNMELSPHIHKKLSINLIQILHRCYSKYIYRLNFTLSTLFYVPKYKSFKLDAFGRIKSILSFGDNPDTALKTIEEKKFKLFSKCFKKDLFAVCDLILYFKKVGEQNLRTINTLRKKFITKLKKGGEQEEIEEDKNYIMYVEKILHHSSDRYLLEFIKMSIFSYEIAEIDKVMADIVPIMQSIQKQIYEYEMQLEAEQFDDQRLVSEQANKEQEKQDSIDLDSLEEVKLLESLQINFSEQYKNLALNKEKLSESEQIYKELIYQSITYTDKFEEYYDKFKAIKKPVLQEAYIQILYAFYQIKSMNDESWQQKLEYVSQFIEKAIDVLRTVHDDSVDNFHITLLFQVMTLSLRKPITILNQLQRCITNQLQKKMQMDHKLRSQNQAKGMLEQKKHVILQVWYAQSYLISDNYSQAIVKIQKVIGFQLKNQHQASLSYGYSLLVSGEIARMSLSPVSAMLNLEMSLAIYNQFFPEYKKVEQSRDPDDPYNVKYKNVKVKNLATSNKAKVEFLLGLSYFETHDQENSLKCLRNAQELMLRSFHMYADEVVFLVLQQMQIYVLQDDIGHVMNIALVYANDMNAQYRAGRQFKRKIISKLQFIIGSVFEFNGQYLSAIRFIERSNRTLTNSKSNNFVIQMHYQAKKMHIISKIKDAFQKIRNKQSIRSEQDLSLFQTLNEAMGCVFQTLFFKQPITLKSSVLLNKFGKQLIKVQGLIRIGLEDKALVVLKEILKVLVKVKKDEIYAFIQERFIMLSLPKLKFNDAFQQIMQLLEIHDRYLQFPHKHHSLIKCSLIVLCLILQQGNSKLIFDQFAKIESTIEDFHSILLWQANPASDQGDIKKQNKFETISKKGKISMVYQIYCVIDQIEYYNKMKRKVFDNLQNLAKLAELGQMCHKKLTQPNQAIVQLFLKKQECLLGCRSAVKIQIQPENEESGKHVKNRQSLVQISENTTQAETSQQQKIIFDLRSIDQILDSKKHSHKHQQSEVLMKVEEVNDGEKTKRHKKNETEVSLKKKTEYKINPFQSTMKRSTKTKK